MSITPLYTRSELDTLITALKQAELALSSGTVSEYSLDIGGSNRRVVYRTPAQVRASLLYYQGQRIQLETGGGPQSIQGRVLRG
jgi:hypothetical protein